MSSTANPPASRSIVIAEPDPAWSTQFCILAAEIRRALGALALSVDHIGSTSVPGLIAKDIIDMQATVYSLDGRADIIERLQAIGYILRPHIDHDHIPPGFDVTDTDKWRKLFLVTPPGARRAHVHVRQLGYPNQQYALLFRDYLRAHPNAATAYGKLKRQLAPLCAGNWDVYYTVKDPACDLIMYAAYEWEAKVNWRSECWA